MENDFDPGRRLGRVRAASRFTKPSTTRRDGLVTKSPEVSPPSPRPTHVLPPPPTPAPKTITVFFYGDKAIHFLGCASYGHCVRTHTHTQRHSHTWRDTHTHTRRGKLAHMLSKCLHRKRTDALRAHSKKKKKF